MGEAAGPFGLQWKDVGISLATGVASFVGYAWGPLGSALLGGAVGGILTGLEVGFTKSDGWAGLNAGIEAALIGGAMAAIPGGFAERMALRWLAPVESQAVGALVSGVGAAIGNRGHLYARNALTATPTPKPPDRLPTKIIG